jgi:hypothetical protein
VSTEVLDRRAIAKRLFLTCWIVYSAHVATNMVRENYLALAIGDDLSFRVDAYAGMHDDIFEHPGFGWHIGSNPGASMIGAIPYAVSRPVIDAVVRRVNARRESTDAEPPAYHTPIPTDRQLYEEAWRRGYDVRFGLASVVMQSLAMAVICAFGVVVMYLLLDAWLGHRHVALWLALLYAFGTPAFYRAGVLNHNMMIATAGLLGFAVLWDRWNWERVSLQARFFLAGLCGGMALLLDYSGMILLAGLWLYGVTVIGPRTAFARSALRLHVRYALGALGPVLLLWFYQWRSFGHPFLPPQHWMPPEAYFELGYLGIAGPNLEIMRLLAVDYRFGLFVSCPLFLLALFAPIANRSGSAQLPWRELVACLTCAVAFLLFFSGVHHVRWQFNTGIRYLAPTFPFLFLATAVVLLRLPRIAAWTVGMLSVGLAWMMAMSRDVSGGKVELTDAEVGRGVLDPVLTVLTQGPQLPVLTTLSRMEGYGPVSANIVRPWHIFVLLAIVLTLVWKTRGRASH